MSALFNGNNRCSLYHINPMYRNNYFSLLSKPRYGWNLESFIAGITQSNEREVPAQVNIVSELLKHTLHNDLQPCKTTTFWPNPSGCPNKSLLVYKYIWRVAFLRDVNHQINLGAMWKPIVDLSLTSWTLSRICCNCNWIKLIHLLCT